MQLGIYVGIANNMDVALILNQKSLIIEYVLDLIRFERQAPK